MQRKRIPSLVLSAIGVAASIPALADDPCLAFKWDISKEHALFGGSPAALSAGTDAPSAPTISAGRLYALTLAPQAEVSFAVGPGKKSAPDGAYAGLAVLQLTTGGDYRVSVSEPLWIDVVGDGKLAEVEDYQGLHSCHAPHKVVAFNLAGAKRFIVQISGATQKSIRLTVTKSPPRT
jgi:hypothetical protein